MKRIALIAIPLLAWGCTPARVAETTPRGPVIVRVAGRESTITARASVNGPTYSVEDRSGQTVVPAMTINQLQARHPEIARHVQSITASAYAGMD
ncbi:MAG TPA: hypothetical protein VHD56_19190 [Tepidisphaeraceae bacterium]|nr:hypothetical protein [Tepidisphaeraceae bacterium]